MCSLGNFPQYDEYESTAYRRSCPGQDGVNTINYNIIETSPNDDDFSKYNREQPAPLIILASQPLSSDSDTMYLNGLSVSNNYTKESKVISSMNIGDSISQLYYNSYVKPDLSTLAWYNSTTTGTESVINLIQSDSITITANRNTNYTNVKGTLYTIQRSDTNSILWCSENGRSTLGITSANGWVDSNLTFSSSFTITNMTDQSKWEKWFSNKSNNWTEPYYYHMISIAGGWGGVWWVDPKYLQDSDTPDTIILASKSDFDSETGWIKTLKSLDNKVEIASLLGFPDKENEDLPWYIDYFKISSLRDQDKWKSFISKDGDFSEQIKNYNGYRIKIYSSRPLSTTLPLIELK